MTKKTRCQDDACGGGKLTAAMRVFEAARDLFYTRGVRAVGVDEIVQQAGVTKPSLYRAYASKDELVAACLAEESKIGRAAFDAALEEAGPCYEAKLRRVLRHYAAKIADPGFRGCALSNTAVEFPEPGHPGRIVLETCKADLRAELVAIARGLKVAEPEALADGLVLLIEGAMASHHVFGSQGPCASLVTAGDRLIDAHLGARQPA